jgi:hypothetical protein
VRRRLEICYGPDASLEMTASGDRTSVEIRIPAARHARVPAR